MSRFERSRYVARNPAVAALYFDRVINAFVHRILKYSSTGSSGTDQSANGLFGHCTAYYGMVEAQGRGTLHCHMLIWIAGNPSPQVLRDRMAADDGFKAAVFSWLESIISCELPGMTEVREETCEKDTLPPEAPSNFVDPRLRPSPMAPVDGDSATELQFQRDFRETVKSLAIECNWHVHQATCWKHLHPGQPRNDTTCRMGISGTTQRFTELDPETQSILLRRLHPRINNYNDFVLFLLRCNMDIKYVGSGEGAKALVFYITDYITKSTLPAHVGLSALEYALKRNEEKFRERLDDATESEIDRSLFTKTVMSIMARQEISHQQVMSYLVGGGDCYRSHSFRVVHWGDFDRLVSKWESTLPPPEDDGALSETESDYDDEELTARNLNDEVQVTLTFNGESVNASNDLTDYCMRSTDSEFESLSLWAYAAGTTKLTTQSDEARLEKVPVR
ncbi:hypothetical protein DFH06DRAFT_1022312, partial [Mycena polygramma]